MQEKRTVLMEPMEGIAPLLSFHLLEVAVEDACSDAGVSNIRLVRAIGDNIAEVWDDSYPRPVNIGLMISAEDIESNSIARIIITPGYSLDYFGEAPNDPQDGIDEYPVGKYLWARDVARDVVIEVIRTRIAAGAERRGQGGEY